MPIRSSAYAACAVVVAALVVGAAAPVAAAPPPDPARPGPSGSVGAPGVGDPFFPNAGNGGIDVQDYDLRLAYSPGTKRLEGTATLRIVATQDLSRFDLDLRGFTLGTVAVDGLPATTGRSGQELQIPPKRPLRISKDETLAMRFGTSPAPARHAAAGARPRRRDR